MAGVVRITFPRRRRKNFLLIQHISIVLDGGVATEYFL